MATYKTITDPLALTLGSGGGATTQTFATGINDSGDLVGYYYAENGAIAGYIDIGGVFTTISDPNANGQPGSTFAEGVNDKGEVVGYYNDAIAFPDQYKGFAEIGGVYTMISDPNGVSGTEAYGVNNYGTIVGTYTNSSGNTYGFKDVKGKYTTISVAGASNTWVYGINDKGEMVGAYENSAGDTLGFLDDNGKITTIGAKLAGDGVTDVQATGINDKGEIVGYCVSDVGDQGFVDIAGKITMIDDPHGNGGSQLFGVNSAGEAVGSYTQFNSNSLFPSLIANHGFTWS
jgi:hypothetical protein